ncbi:MAG: peptidoglycan editing factor PgeF [Ignavibacteria bacterium]|nr:peptidoglycan editing factor PgeF [Ignavibacteria bacterium]
MNLSFSVGDSETNVQRNRELFFERLNIPLEKLAIQKQIHSNYVRKISTPGIYEQTDAMYTQEKNIFLCVTVADCMPIFLFDCKENIVAVVHSGWRGCVNEILRTTIVHLLNEHSIDEKNIFCYIGPSAGKCCYEIESDVASNFSEQFLTKRNEHKFLLDMQSFARDELLQCGVPFQHIEISNACTIHQKEFFHSYRRDGTLSGRMMGVLGII